MFPVLKVVTLKSLCVRVTSDAFLFLWRREEFTRLVARVRVEALRFEHDEQGAPAEQHGREEQVFDDRGHGHPPAARKGCGQGWSHGGAETEKETWPRFKLINRRTTLDLALLARAKYSLS